MSDEPCPHDHVDGWYVGIEGCRGCGQVVDWHDGETAPVFRELDALRGQVATLMAFVQTVADTASRPHLAREANALLASYGNPS